MEFLGLFVRLQLNFVTRGEYLVRDWAPTVTFYPLIPAIVVIILRLVIFDINLLLPSLLFDRIVVSGCEGIDVDHATVSEDFVVDQRWETLAAKSESNVTSGSSVEKTSFRRVDTLEQLVRFTFLFEVD